MGLAHLGLALFNCRLRLDCQNCRPCLVDRSLLMRRVRAAAAGFTAVVTVLVISVFVPSVHASTAMLVQRADDGCSAGTSIRRTYP